MNIHSEIGPWGGLEGVITALKGEWSFKRIIEGHGSMQGMASVVTAPAEEFFGREERLLHYREKGRLLLTGGEEFESEREYLFDRSDNGFAVYFKETPRRLFHTISLERQDGGLLRGGSVHWCHDDVYKTLYEFLPDGQFVIQHDVTGPRKDYRIFTKYVRLQF